MFPETCFFMLVLLRKEHKNKIKHTGQYLCKSEPHVFPIKIKSMPKAVSRA